MKEEGAASSGFGALELGGVFGMWEFPQIGDPDIVP